MKKKLEGYTFDFPAATKIVKFDGPDHHLTHAMKAVDVVIELPDYRLFVEVKNFESHGEWIKLLSEGDRVQRLEKLRFDLVYKYRDSLIYHWCSGASNKKNVFVFLTDWSDPIKIHSFYQTLSDRFPTVSQRGKWLSVWRRSFVDTFVVVNRNLWSKTTLSKWGTIV